MVRETLLSILGTRVESMSRSVRALQSPLPLMPMKVSLLGGRGRDLGEVLGTDPRALNLLGIVVTLNDPKRRKKIRSTSLPEHLMQSLLKYYFGGRVTQCTSLAGMASGFQGASLPFCPLSAGVTGRPPPPAHTLLFPYLLV